MNKRKVYSFVNGLMYKPTLNISKLEKGWPPIEYFVFNPSNIFEILHVQYMN
jgi:hypothetical protein